MAAPILIPDISLEEQVPLSYISEAEYLRTSYRPDCDYIEGRVEERNVGEYEHSRV